ncbi:MAG: site-2 protease family protein [Parcubacteria group bacterium]
MGFESKIFLYLIVVFSAVFHEYMHAWTAYYLGDPTAKYAGRLTLNPLKHLDPIWTVAVPLLMLFVFGGFIGAAKPVPYNPYNLRDQKYGHIKVGFAGPAANFSIALVFGLLVRFFAVPEFMSLLFSWIIYINIFLGLFNLLPFPPLDGSKLLISLFPNSSIVRFLEHSFLGIFLAIIIAINFLPYIASFLYFLITGGSF